jgi:hypothetical protein
MQNHIEIDGQFVVISETAGVTKVLMTPFQPVQNGGHTGCSVFFDMLTKGQMTLRFSRELPASTDEKMEEAGPKIDKLFAEMNELRTELVDAVKNYLSTRVVH